MKKWIVYELINLMGSVEHVGETTNLRTRYNFHRSSAGNFTKRSDIIMNPVKEFHTKKEAYDYQCVLQKEYGLKSDREIMSIAKQGFQPSHKVKVMGGKAGGKVIADTTYICPHCMKEGKGVIMKRWHFNNCKEKI